MSPDYEGALQVAYESFLQRGDAAVDVGAHKGKHAVPIARAILPGGTLIAVEPLPMCRPELQSALSAEFPDAGAAIRIEDCALGEAPGEAEFVVAAAALEYSGLRERVYDVPTTLERIHVKVRTLDELTAHLGQLRYIKVDAEGGEYHILRGGRELLRRLRPIVSFEFGANSIGQYGITPADMSELLQEAEYRCFDIRGRDVTPRDSFTDSAIRQEVWDYFAVPAESQLFAEKILPALTGFFCESAAVDPWQLCESRLAREADGPLRLRRDATAPVSIRVTNTSGHLWNRSPGGHQLNLGIIWHAWNEGPVPGERLGENRAQLPLPLSAGGTAAVRVSLRPVGYNGGTLPAGRYRVWINPVIEGVTWFFDRGDSPLELEVVLE